VLGLGLSEVGNHRPERRWGRRPSWSILGYRGVSSTYVSMQMHTISMLPSDLLRSRRGIVDPKLISDILWSTHYSLITAYDHYQVLIVTMHALLLSCVPYYRILLLFIYIHRLFPLILIIFIAIGSRKDFLQLTASRCASI